MNIRLKNKKVIVNFINKNGAIDFKIVDFIKGETVPEIVKRTRAMIEK